MSKNIEELLKVIISQRRSGSDPLNLSGFVVNVLLFSVVIIAGTGAYVSYYFTRKHFEHKVDPQVLYYIKNPGATKEIEQETVKILEKKRMVQQQYDQLKSDVNQNEAKLREIETTYSQIKNKMFNEKVIYDEAFNDKISELQNKHQEELKKVQEDAYDDGVGSGVVGTLGVQMLLED